MTQGSIQVGDYQGVNVIKMIGDVRLTLCLSFDTFIDEMFGQSDFSRVVFDLTEADAIDSTTLGLMAKISIIGRNNHYEDAIVISSNPSIDRLLNSMGFEDIFNIMSREAFYNEISELDIPLDQSLSVNDGQKKEKIIHETVLEAHKTLMLLNQNNKETFKELVATLEAYQ